MTKFRFDFQDLIVFVGMRQPANRVALVPVGSIFRSGPPPLFLFLLRLLFLPIFQNDSWCRLLLRLTNNALRRDSEKKGMHSLVVASCACCLCAEE